ncbi:PREDICTED: glucosamine-6-phosphate isomerase 2 [Propithecus coquereli]|uniref:Glucosamine-6-phosphate deaminase 2 n=1 Tax=Propithecus coquereli TaxID=379532 RepID=A0A2K6EVQ2_PROCO|nr:PREDICTED: glucosamine-6-phosphate isomerase 2 [Propithecus coquereli]
MRLVILDNYDLASEWAAKYICNRIIQFKPGQDRYFTLGLPTGNKPLFPFLDTDLKGIGPDGHIAFNEPGSSLVSRTRLKTLAMDTILANAKYFDGDLAKVPTMALTVGVGTVMDAREVMILITGAHKAFALYKAIEEGVNHMWTVSAFQQHPRTIFVCDEDATLELRVKTVKYFKGEH